MKDIIGNCPLCEERALHVAGTEGAQVMQCINCGYTTSTKFKGIKADNEEFQKLGEDMKNWAKEENEHIWIPSIITLPIGMLYPVNIKKEMKWAFAPMVEIPEDERKNFPNENNGFYERKIDTDNPTIYNLFIEGMTMINEMLKQKVSDGE
jgi:Zn ribbon nucleic-acid-binding protein